MRALERGLSFLIITDPLRGAKKAKSSNPIIMISSAPTSLITMWNVKKFLEQGL
jgi:parafibromin